MKRILTCLFLLAACNTQLFAYSAFWKPYIASDVPPRGEQKLHPSKYLIYALNTQALTAQLANVSANPEAGAVIELPTPDGSFRSFKVWETSNMEAPLAAKYPMIKSYTASALDNKNAIAKIDLSPYGFGAMVFDGNNTYLVDPFSNINDGYYLCYYKHDYVANKGLQCNVDNDMQELKLKDITTPGKPGGQLKVNGAVKHTYRLALACTGDYAVTVAGVNPVKSAVLSAMNKSLSRVNGVYETELSIHMDLVANEDTLIFLDGTTDPYDNLSDPLMQTQNQTTVAARIGAANYDIGHVFGSGIGGIADLGCVCDNNTKARGLTGQTNPVGDAFDIDYVVHEMGHQFGATHTFNAATDACGNNNAWQSTAYEPGSGSTIMAYAGICGSGDNLQGHSDDYFHAVSLNQISDYTILNNGSTCGALAPSGNTPNLVSNFSSTYYIPYHCPVEFTAPQAMDLDNDPVTYCWEEWDLGDFQKSFAPTNSGPIFRSFKGTSSQTRVCPMLDKVRANIYSYLGEKEAEVQRTLTFTLTTRDVHNGWGCFNTPSDKIIMLVNPATSGHFEVQQPNTAADYWQVGSTVTVNWDTSNTRQAPISSSAMDIFLSLDDGQTYPYTLATAVPNTGSATVTVPIDAYTASARVKVKGSGNVYFDISNAGFVINSWPSSVHGIASAGNDISVYPVPATNEVHVRIGNNSQYSLSVTDMLGRCLLIQSDVATQADISVAGWSKGVYNLQLRDKSSDEKIVRRIVVE